MKKIIKTVVLLLLYQVAFAQNEADVLRYSTTDVFGSARFEAMAGSFGGLGADISAIQINPAGMGRFSSRSEEHTSELQSRPHLVCRLLLEKKKKKKKKNITEWKEIEKEKR